MVRNDEMQPTTEFTKEIAAQIRAMLGKYRITQKDLSNHFGRAQSYVSVRLQGARAFDTGELEIISKLVGLDPIIFMRHLANQIELSADDGLPPQERFGVASPAEEPESINQPQKIKPTTPNGNHHA